MELALIKSAWLEKTDPIWSMKLLKLAVGIVEAQKGKHRQKHTKRVLPTSWKVSHQYHIAHNDVGGVTNGVFL